MPIQLRPLRIAAFFGAMLAQALCAQTRPAAQAPPASSAPVSFHSDLLDLSFAYPGSLTPVNLPSPEKQHAAADSGKKEDESSVQAHVDRCTDRILLARRADRPGDSEATAVTASLLISRVGVGCMPTEYGSHVDAIAAALTQEATNGLKIIDQPIGYAMGGTGVHFIAAHSAPAGSADSGQGQDQEQDESGESRWVASLGFAWKGNIVIMRFEANDLAFLNEMLRGEIRLGSQPGVPVFPAEIGAGKAKP